MIGPLVSLRWLGLAYMAGLLGLAVERVPTCGNSSPEANIVALFALATAVVAVLMTVLGIVVVYYGILLRWFWDMIPT